MGTLNSADIRAAGGALVSDVDALGDQLYALVATLTGAALTPLTISNNTAIVSAGAGAKLFDIGGSSNSPIAKVTLTPNDGRIVVGGNSKDGWVGYRGLSAWSTGAISIAITEDVRGAEGSPKTTTFNFTVLAAANQAPTNIIASYRAGFSGGNVPESAPIGSVLADLTFTDPDLGDTCTFSKFLDADGKFAVVGSTIVLAATIDYETKTSHAVTVQATDQGGLSYSKVFTFTVLDVSEAAGRTYGAGGGVPDYEPSALPRQANLAALLSQRGLSSGDVIDYARDGYSSVRTLISDAEAAGKLWTIGSGTYNVGPGYQFVGKGGIGYGAINPKFVTTDTKSTTAAVNWGTDNRAWLILKVEDAKFEWIDFEGFGVLAATVRHSQPLVGSTGVSNPYPYYTSTNKLLKILDPRGAATGFHTKRVGKITLAGGTGTVSALIGRRQLAGTAFGASTNNYFYPSAFDAAWATDQSGINWPARTAIMDGAVPPLISGATGSGNPAAVAALLITAINAQTGTTGTSAVAGPGVGEVYLLRDTGALTATQGPGDYLSLGITTTGSLTATWNTCSPRLTFLDCNFIDVDTIAACQLDALAPGLVQFARCTGKGVWCWTGLMATRWSGGGVLASNVISADCIGVRKQPNANGVNTVNTIFYCGANAPIHSAENTAYGTLFRVENCTFTNLESACNSNDTNSAVGIDCRHPGANSVFQVMYCDFYRVVSLTGAEDSNATYVKALGGGVKIARNRIRQCGSYWLNQSFDGCETSDVLIKEGPHGVTAGTIEISENLFHDSPPAAPVVKIDENLGTTAIWGNTFSGWSALFGGPPNYDAGHAGPIRITNKVYKVQIYRNRFAEHNFDRTYYGINLHNLTGTVADCANWRIDNNEWINSGSGGALAYTGDRPLIRANWNSSPTGGSSVNLAKIKTGFNLMKAANGSVVGNATLFVDGTAGYKTGTLAANSDVITSVSNGTTGMLGRTIEAVGVPGIATVTELVSSTSMRISVAATVDQTKTYLGIYGVPGGAWTGTGAQPSAPWTDPTPV